MFTGIVEGARAVLLAVHRVGSLHLDVNLGDLGKGVSVGDSIAISGCCLTVSSLAGECATFHVMAESLGLTTLGRLTRGSLVNVERSLRVGDRLGGHFVSGHVDGVGRVTSVSVVPGQTDLDLEIPDHLAVLVIPKGSLAIDGVSLTLTKVSGRQVSVSLIPHTLAATTLGRLAPGDRVNLEADMIGKWVRRLLPPQT